jgi:hypothetical protein
LKRAREMKFPIADHPKPSRGPESICGIHIRGSLIVCQRLVKGADVRMLLF